MSSEALWAYGRSSGVVSLLLFTLVAVLGIVATSGRPVLGLSRTTLTRVHRSSAVLALLFLAVHVLTLTLDSYALLHVADWFLPFRAERDTFAYGLGTVAADLVLVTVLSGILRRWLPGRVFRWLHAAAYLSFGFGWFHSLLSATDGPEAWYMAVLAVSALGVLAAGIWRLSPRFHQNAGSRRMALRGSAAARTGASQLVGNGHGAVRQQAPAAQHSSLARQGRLRRTP